MTTEPAILFPGPPWVPQKARSAMRKLLALDQMDRAYATAAAVGDASVQKFSEESMLTLGIGYEISSEPLRRIPKEGPVLVIANHPFGLLEGLILCAELTRFRTDMKILANR